MKDRTDRLREVLAAYGADPARWPAGDRTELVHLIDGAGEGYRDALEVDRLLQLASAPEQGFGANERLIRYVHALQSTARRPVLRWTAALPLAASLLLGIYLGGQEDAAAWLPGLEQASTEDEADDDLSGIGEAETYAEENLS